MRAFSDESERANTMLLAVVLVEPGTIDGARSTLASLLLAGERRIHTAKESPRRRRVLLDTVARMELRAVVWRYRRPRGVTRIAARHLLLQVATAFVVDSAVDAWTLDDEDPAQQARDRASIAHQLAGVGSQPHPTYEHRPAHAEPLLWAADAIGWATGAGGDWRRRIAGVLTVRDLQP